jgi:prepilin-type N-terminal cleavage/methylation domain-containing protein
MDTKNTNKSKGSGRFSLFLSGSLSHLLRSSPAPSRGFTLVEMMVTLAVIGLLGAVAGTMIGDKYEGEVTYQTTVEIMNGIRKAILGDALPLNRGVHISGYVADMGGLPALNEDGQPEALWKKTAGLAGSRYYSNARIHAGWNGPYIQEPDSDFLTDGWGNGLQFVSSTDGTLTITSYGADLKQGGIGLDEDIILEIRKHHYMAPLGFSFKGAGGDASASSFTVHFPHPKTGALQSQQLQLQNFDAGSELERGFFLSGDANKPLFPIGLRSVTAVIRHGSDPENEEERVILFPIQSGMNYMGLLD